jgi:hypothetical protein
VRRTIFIIVAIFALALPALALADHGPGSDNSGTGSGDQPQLGQQRGGEVEPGDDRGDDRISGDDRPSNPFEFDRRHNFGSPEDNDLGDDQDAFFFAGEVTAVDATAGTLTLKVRWPGDHGRHHGHQQLRNQGADDKPGDDNRPENATITVKADANTAIFRNGADATLADIVVGDVVHVVIVADEGQTREEALASPAFAIMARAKKTTVTYGFAGRVKAVDTTAGTLTLTVTKATRRARALLGSDATQDVTFTIGESTVLILDGESAELGDYKPGDAAAIGVKASKTATLAEISATPARVVLGQKANVNPTTTAGSARLRKLSVRAAKAVR